MKILLINPNCTYFPGTIGPSLKLPLGLLYIAAQLEKNGFTPKIFDCLISQEMSIREENGFVVHGVGEDILKRVITEEAPDVIGISNPFTAQIGNAIKTAETAKKLNPKIITVIGGPHVSVAGKTLLEMNKAIDYGIKGEGEYAFLELIRKLSKGESAETVKSLIYRKKSGEVVSTEWGGFIQNIDDLPYPAYHLIDIEKFFGFFKQGWASNSNSPEHTISFITSRGCPYNCVFCSINLHMGRLFRPHSAEYVVDHLSYIVGKYHVKHISIEDDNFTIDINRTKKILKGIIDKNIKITWDTPNGIRADIIDEELAQLMKQSGCTGVVLAIESGSQRVLDEIIDKKLDLSKVEKKIKIFVNQRIKIIAFFVIGFPYETKDDIDKTIKLSLDLYKKYDIESALMIATPLLGTRLYNICKRDNLLVKEPDPQSLALATQSLEGEGLITTAEFTPAYLKAAVRGRVRAMARLQLRKRLLSFNGWLKMVKCIVQKPMQSIKFIKTLASGG